MPDNEKNLPPSNHLENSESVGMGYRKKNFNMKKFTFLQYTLPIIYITVGIFIGASMFSSAQDKDQKTIKKLKVEELEIVDQHGNLKVLFTNGYNMDSKTANLPSIVFFSQHGTPSLLINNPIDSDSEPTISFLGGHDTLLKLGVSQDDRVIFEKISAKSANKTNLLNGTR